MSAPEWIEADWPVPPGVHAAFTTRRGGASGGPWAAWNLGDHVGDDPAAVAENRNLLRAALALPADPRWLRQVHGCAVAGDGDATDPADAAVTGRAGTVLAILTADCLPVLFCDRAGERLGAAHAGWRGLAAGVLEATVAAMDRRPGELMAWLGPAIGPRAFEVGDEVRTAFLAADPDAGDCFRPSPAGRWLADLPQLARRRLAAAGVGAVHGGGTCTHADPARFFSHRRDGRCGRMAALLWRD